MEEKKRSLDAAEWAYDRYVKGHPELEAYFTDLDVQSDVAQQIYDVRNKLRMSRKELAELSGLSAEVIEDLEETDYEGNWDEAVEKINRAFRHWFRTVILPAARMTEDEYAVKVVSG
jgi:ribosome-binding protein aMBF1 (putative translation factor)